MMSWWRLNLALLMLAALSQISLEQDLTVTVNVLPGGSPSLALLAMEGQTVSLCYTPQEPPTSTSVVSVSTQTGTAEESDFQSLAVDLMFIGGSRAPQCVDVIIASDDVEEGMEEFMVIAVGMTGDYADYVGLVLFTISGAAVLLECPLLPDPEGGSVVITGFTPGNVAIYSCAEPGTQLSGDSLRICEPTGVWSGSQPTCIAGDCEVLDDPINGRVFVSDISIGATATYECNPGYIIIGSVERQCQEIGEWSGTPPICNFVDCGGLSDPANGEVSLSDTTFGSIASYVCDSGFNLIGDMQRICQENEDWSGSEPICEVAECGFLMDPDNGLVTLTGSSFGSIATYVCDTGFNLIGDMQRTCQENEDWSGSEPTCELAVVDCGSLDDPDNGQVSPHDTTFGSIATYVCDTGFNLIGDMQRTCQENEDWSGSEPTCELAVVDCGSLDDPDNGQVSPHDTTFGSIATYVCDSGFNQIGDMQRTCQMNGDWSGSEPICEVAECGFLMDPDNGLVTLTGSSFGSIATYVCDTGFNLIGDMQRTCQENEDWSGSEPTCELAAVDCGSLDDPDNGQVSPHDTTFGSIATYECDTGFNLIGDMQRTCQENEDWSGSEPTCELAVVDCGSLDDPDNGQVSPHDTTFGSIATYVCDTGFNLIGDMQRICQENEDWSGSEPICEVAECGFLMDPDNGLVTLTGSSFGSIATYVCDTEFNLIGNMQRTCQENEDWSGSEPTCQTVDCGSLDDPDNGEVSLSDTTFDSIASYVCDSGFNLIGDKQRTCQENEDWSGSEPTCQIVDCGSLDDPDNGDVSPHDTTFGSIATYVCDTGLDLIGDMQRICQVNEDWSGSEPTCEFVDCGSLSHPDNGQVVLSATTFGSIAIYICDNGFNLIGDMQRTCQENEDWSGSEPTCELVSLPIREVFLGFTAQRLSIGEGDREVDVCFGLLENSSVLTQQLRVTASMRESGCINATADEDYAEMTVILLLSAGMSAGNHNCFSVKIHDDVFFEDRETFSVVLDSLETESGEAVPDLMSVLRQRTEVIITDDEILIAEFVETHYTVVEGGPSVDVCLRLLEGTPISFLGAPVIIRVMSIQDTAMEAVDYSPVLQLIAYHIGEAVPSTTERCLSVAALADDDMSEGTEEFTLQLVTGNVAIVAGGSASVMIQNVRSCSPLNPPDNGSVTITNTSLGGVAQYECDPGFTLVGSEVRECTASGEWTGTSTVLCFFFTFASDTPLVNGNSIALTFEPTEGIISAFCTVSTQPTQECTSGSAVFYNLPLTRVRPHTVTVQIILPENRNTSLTQLVRTETSGVCSAHIINSGVTVTSERTVMIDWQATGPTLEKRVGNERLECTLFHLDTGMKDTYPSCPLPPFTRTELPAGNYEFFVVQNKGTDAVCRRRIGLQVPFTVL